MSFTLRSLKVPPNSVNLEEARSRMFEFFRLACLSIPSIIDIYNLDEVVTKSQLRSTIAAQIRKNSQVTNPKTRLTTYTPEQINELCYVDVNFNKAVSDSLRNNPKVYYDGKRFSYKHALKDKSQLLILVRKFPEGITVIDLKDAYPIVTYRL